MKTLLLYNPVAGRNRESRKDQIAAICALLAAHDFQPTALETTGTDSAAGQVGTALHEGFDCIVACGGDGTVHDVLQGLIDPTRSPDAAQPILGIIPMGSANVLARHLGLSMSPIEAARQLLGFKPRSIPIGLAVCGERRRFFTVMAGCGPDGALVYRMLPGAKRRLGRLAYYIRAAVLFASRRFAPFELTWTEAGSSAEHRILAAGTMAVRIDDLGGLFRHLAPAARVHQPHLHLIAIRAPAWLSMPAWFAVSWLGASRWNPLVQALCVTEFTCTPRPGQRVHVQADGEWIGIAPVHVSLIPNAVRLLMPPEPEELPGGISAGPQLPSAAGPAPHSAQT